MDSIDCMASIDCYSFSEHILVYVFVSLIGVYMSRGGPTRTAYSIFSFYLFFISFPNLFCESQSSTLLSTSLERADTVLGRLNAAILCQVGY